ncbi:hypothetical protein MHYP_G00243690 [Metynnis hypsauchen]
MMKTAKFHHQRWTLLFFCLWEIFISESVSSTSAQEEVLNVAVGESITFPTRVLVTGSIRYKDRNIGLVVSKHAETDFTEEFKNRLHWDSQSGLFTLSDLRADNSGVYTVRSDKEEKGQQAYLLNLYDKVSAPQVIKINSSSAEIELCSLLCSVRNVRGLNLFWFKGKVSLNHINSLNDTLNLHLKIEKFDNDPYSCVASNPVSKQTITVNVTELCPHKPDGVSESVSQTYIFTIIISTAVAVIGMVVFLWRKKSTSLQEKQQNDSDLLTEVIYTVTGP